MREALAVERFILIIKIVSAYGKCERAVFGYPVARRYAGIHKEQNIIVY